MSISDALLSAEGLKVELGGASVLDIPSFHLLERDVLTIIGPNGSGKTTLLLTLAGLLKPVAGRIAYRGERIESRDAAFRFRRKIAMLFQQPLLFDTTVYNNVISGLKMRGGLSRTEARERAMKYMRRFHCDHLSDRSARKLSGGEAQRTSLARAFAVEPEILFLDEPFSSLDPPTRLALTHDLYEMVKETGTTTVLVTHLESETLSMSGRTIVMNGGKIVQTGSPSAVMNHPADEFVARFVGTENILNGRVLSCGAGSLVAGICGREIRAGGQALPEEEVTCCIRPEYVAVSTSRHHRPTEELNVFAGRISHVYWTGSFLRLRLDCGFPLTSLTTREAFSDLDLAEGTEIYASFRPSAVHVLRKNRE